MVKRLGGHSFLPLIGNQYHNAFDNLSFFDEKWGLEETPDLETKYIARGGL